jgi:hydrogenase expression/formation protein HypC
MCLGIPGKIVAIADAGRMLATVDVAGVRRDINVACVHDAAEPLDSLIGAWVLVHVGFAMSVINEDEAAETLRILSELGEVAAEAEAMRASAVA